MKALRSCVLALAVLAALAMPLPANVGSALDPYRALARGPEGARLLAMARAAMEHEGEPALPHAAARPLPPPPAALYVTLVRGSTTRACVGSDPPQGADLVEAVRALAAQALTGDRRRPPVRGDELDELRVVIAFAAPAEAVAVPEEVDPGREGLLIETAQGRVAFLPGEARTVAWALREARRIGLLVGPASTARYFRFQVVTISEAAPPAAERKEFNAVP